MKRDEALSRWVRIAGLGLAAMLHGCAPGGGPADPASNAARAPEVAQGADADVGASGVPALLARQAPPPLRAVPGEYLVKFKAGTSRASVTRVFGKASLASSREFRSVPGLHLVRTGKGDAESAQFKAALAADPQVEYIEPNFIQRAFAAPDDPEYPKLWAMHNTGQTGSPLPYNPDIGAEAAWEITTGSDDIVVAVIDTGVDYTHEDLAANIWQNPDDCDADGVDDDTNGYVDDCHGIDTVAHDSDPMDERSHGTHVSGTIGALGNNGIGVVGVAWRVRILPCRFLDAQGNGPTAAAIECLDYLARLKQRGVNLIASNNSWGSQENSRALADAIRAQRDLGVLFVAAAGNDRQDVDVVPSYPCAYEVANVICVASAYEYVDGWFSNSGRGTVLLGAPGSNIVSTVPGNKYESLDGTSMATPHVSGALVLLKAQDPTRNFWQLRNLLAAGAVPPRELSIPSVTGGRLSVINSLTCTDATVLGRLSPMTFEALSRPPGGEVVIRALHVKCAAPEGNVTVSVAPGGELVTLRDDGAAPDEIAGDGVYAGKWIAHGEGDFTFSFPAPETETFTVNVDPWIKPGFPGATAMQFDEYGGGRESPPVIGNISGDARLEILSLTPPFGPVTAWNSDGALLQGWPRHEGGLTNGLNLGNFDSDPADLEVMAHYVYAGIFLYQGDGSPMPGWPQFSMSTLPAFTPVADLDGDGIDEVIGYPARRADGTLFRGDVRVPAYPEDDAGAAFGLGTGDLDADGQPDFVSTSTRNSSSSLWISDANGVRAGYPVPVPGGTNTVSAQRPLIGDVDGDGVPDIVLGSFDYPNARCQVQVFDNRGAWRRTLYGSEFGGDGLALADLDRDGIPEILATCGPEVNVWRGDGSVFPGWPRNTGNARFGSEPSVGDVDGDGQVDVVAVGFEPGQQWPDGQAKLVALRTDGSYLPGFPKSLHSSLSGGPSPAIADIDLDGRNDLVVSYSRGVGLRENLFAYDLQGPGPYGPIEWSQGSGDARHRGYYETGKNLPGQAILATQVYGAGVVTANGGGINCRGDCIEKYARGANVVLTAAARTGGTFARWRGACAGQGNPCTLPMQKFTETSADFDSRVSVQVTGAGVVTTNQDEIHCPGDCEAVFPARTLVRLTAVETASGAFSGWSGACSGMGVTCELLIDDVKNVRATFVSEHSLTINKIGTGNGRVTTSPAGIDCGAACSANFPVRSIARVSEGADADSYFVGWHRLGCLDYQPTCDIDMNAPVTLNVEFALKPVLAVTIRGNGRLTSVPAGVDCRTNCNAPVGLGSVTLHAIADAGWHFERYEGLCDGQGNIPNCGLNIQGNAAVTAVFARDPVLTVTRSGSGSGRVDAAAEFSCPTTCAPSFASGRVLTLTATASDGSSFTGWSGACSGTGSCVITVVDDIAVTATFTRNSSGGGSSSSGSGGGGGGGRIDWLMLAALALLSAERLVQRVRRLRKPHRLLLPHVEAILEPDAELPR